MRPTTTTTTIERNEAILAEIFRLLLISSRMRMSQIPNGSHSSHFFFSSFLPLSLPHSIVTNTEFNANCYIDENRKAFIFFSRIRWSFFPPLSFFRLVPSFLFPLVELKEKKERTWRIQQQHKSRRRLWESN